MSLIPTVYRSTDPGAPALTGQVGSMTALLDAVLVDGYGPVGAEKAPLGWTREFTEAGRRAYRQAGLTSSMCYLYVDDRGIIMNARQCLMRGFESMTGLDDGVNGVPTEATYPNGWLWPKSHLLDGSSRTWTIIGNERSFYMCANVANRAWNDLNFAGDLVSYRPADVNAFALTYADLNTAWPGNASQSFTRLNRGATLSVAMSGLGSTNGAAGQIIRSHTGAVGPVAFQTLSEDFQGSVVGGGGVPFPDPVSGGVLLRRLTFREAVNRVRGHYPGLLVPWHNMPFADGEVVTGLEGVGGSDKRFLALSFGSSASLNGQALFELDSEW